MIKTDILIIGGGVVGGSIAQGLSHYDLDILLVEKGSDIATGTSKANSGIIHAGYNSSDKTLKGQLNIQAVDRFDKLCNDLKVPFNRIGSLLVGFNNDDLKILREKKENGLKLGIKDLEILRREKLFSLEPNLNKDIKFALYAPTAGIISPYQLTISLINNAVINGVKVLLNTEVKNIITENKKIKKIETNKDKIKADLVINAAGVFADEIARMGGDQFKIVPRKGEYYLFDEEYGDLVNHVIFPMPSEKSKGILVTPTVHENLLIGPNACEIEDKNDKSTTREGLNEVFQGAKKLIPSLPDNGVISAFAGLRAAAEGEDFIIGFSNKTEGLLNVAGIQSPGLTSSTAISDMVIELTEEYFQKENKQMSEKVYFQETLPYRPKFSEYRENPEEWQEIIEKENDYGEIICRCELVTKGEILAAIREPVPALTLDAIKRRTRAGMGRCQGGFCGPRVLQIIAEETGISPLEITKRGGDSNILKAKAKELILQKLEKNKQNRKKDSKVGEKNV